MSENETMSKETLELHFKNISTHMEDVKDMFLKIENRQQTQYKKVIILEEHKKSIEKDFEEHKKSTIKNIDDHKTNMRWGIGIVMPTITAIILFVANIFIPKSG